MLGSLLLYLAVSLMDPGYVNTQPQPQVTRGPWEPELLFQTIGTPDPVTASMPGPMLWAFVGYLSELSCQPYLAMRKSPRPREMNLAKVTQLYSVQGALLYPPTWMGPKLCTQSKLAPKEDVHQCHLPPKETVSRTLSLIFRSPRKNRQPWFHRLLPFDAADTA